MMSRSLPINSAARNAVWIYDALVPSRFPGAPAIVEKRRSHEKPDFNALPESADIAVELYGGAITLRLDGQSHRIYIRRFEFVSCTSEEEARSRFRLLWQEVETLESVGEAVRKAEEWRASNKRSMD